MVDRGAGDATAADLLSSLADAATATDFSTAAYPAGPYGNTIGAVIPPLGWVGYSNPLGDALASTRPYAPYSMDALRLSGRRYALVHVAEFY